MVTEFTPVESVLGGLLIGLSIAILYLGHGRIAGISGVIKGLVFAPAGDLAWRLIFLLGMVLGGTWYVFLAPEMTAASMDLDLGTMAISGLLVGVGTGLGNGCTSGHGICGVSRLSPRSILATVVFMGVAFATVYVVRHV